MSIRGFTITVSWWRILPPRRPGLRRTKITGLPGIQGTIGRQAWGIWLKPHEPIRYG